MLALVITAVAWCLMAIGTGAGVEGYMSRDLVIFAAVMVAAHLVVRRWAGSADPLILPCVALLNGLGLVLIDRLDHAEAARALADGEPVPTPDVAHQLIWTIVSVALFAAVVISVRDHRTLSRYGYTFGLAGVVLLMIPAVLPSSISEVNGGKSWIRLHGFSVQPGEFAKVALLIFVAAFLVANRELFAAAGTRVWGMTVPKLRHLAPLLVVTGIAVLVLVVEKNLGFSLLVFGTVLAMIYIATNRVSWLLIGIIMFTIGCAIAYHLFAHVRVRVQVWQDPFASYFGNGYQISQALFGMATGGLGGDGLGTGRPQDVPFAKTDFMISTIGEELGLIGLCAVIMVFLILTMRGFKAALTVRDSFATLLAGGLAFAIGWQLFVVVGGVTKLIPLTGITTPFMSYGGSSLLANYIGIALLIRISHRARTELTNTTPPARAPIADAATALIGRKPQ